MTDSRTKMMIEKLHEQLSLGAVTDEWCSNFIDDMYTRLKSGGTFTPKQLEKIDELFEEY